MRSFRLDERLHLKCIYIYVSVCVCVYIIIYSRYLTAQMWFRGMTVRILPSNLQSEEFAVSFQ